MVMVMVMMMMRLMMMMMIYLKKHNCKETKAGYIELERLLTGAPFSQEGGNKGENKCGTLSAS